MANVLADEKKQQVLALGRLGWPLRRIEEAIGVRRGDASNYLKAEGIAVRSPRARDLPPKPASEVLTDSEALIGSADSDSKPASEVSTDSAAPIWPRPPGRAPASSACEPYREIIEQGVH